MICPLAAFKNNWSPSLSKEGKLVTEIVVPNADIAATALPVQTITKLSGCNVKLGIGPLCPPLSPIRQSCKLIGAGACVF